MCLSKLIKSTLIKEKSAILLYLGNSLLIVLFYYLLYGSEFQVYPFILTGTFLIAYLCYKLVVYRKLYRLLDEGKNSPGYKIEEGYEYKDIMESLIAVHKSYLSEIYNIQLKNEERDSLMSQWIHNMKTCVSVIELAAEEGASKDDDNKEIFKDILEEKIKLQDNLEGALNLFRLEKFSKDYISEKVNLKELVVNAVNSKKRNFIYSKVFPKINIDEKIFVYTDKKWGRYVIEQVISNAIKYSNKENAYVNFSANFNNSKVTLAIEDEGIGIKSQYLNRVFDLFFTGDNGRENKKSTGIGLYMCKLVCEKLNNEITIESEEGKGTRVNISYAVSES